MTLVYAANPVSESHLQEVMREMVIRDQGPMVQAIDFGGYYVALECTHRMEAARRLGYPVVILPIDRHSTVTEDQFDDLKLGGRKWRAKDLGHSLLNKRPKSFTPVYKWDEETGYLELSYYPTCSLKDMYRIVGKTSLVWLALTIIGGLTLL